ncbi:MFS transporter [Agrococcus carbonis]|uniref:Putative proline/betaine transporter n=1 Tax=Agrococcus carbonis TaxID=684552 RepID=A0A1H1NDH0_9MICO|nr:MFS transporter [Agrococcus carbonis]SDR97004.1 Predicted arabinose efflux permease, MFS family [Agrococcus carbonis]
MATTPTTTQHTDPRAAADTRRLRRVATTSFMGTAMEWYDYFIYGLFAALVFDELFFPSFDPAVGTVLALLTFGIGFVARPVGAIIFGHLGDRIGRKKTLVVTLLVIGLSTGIIGLLPTFDAIGFAAPILLTTLRFIQGLSLGGEWSGAVLLAVEHAPAKQRAFYGAMPQYGSPAGTLASSGIVALVTLLPEDDLMAWGWRIPFLLSFVFLAIALYMRLRVEESPVFTDVVQTQRAEQPKAKLPLIEVFRHAGGRVLIVIATVLFASGGFFLMTTYAVNFGTGELGMEPWKLLVATMVGAVLEAIGIYIGAKLGDRWGAWKTVVFGGGIAVVLVVPIALMLGSGVEVLVIVAVALGIGILGIPYGPLGTMLSELFEARYRYSGVAVSYNIGGLIGGFVPSIAAGLALAVGSAVLVIPILLGIIMALCVVGGLIAGRVLSRQSETIAA